MLAVAVVALCVFLVEMPLRHRRPRPLAKGDGPFFVVAHTFRGQEAEAQAYSLAAELRSDHGDTAYLWRPNRSLGPPSASGKRAKDRGVAVLIGSSKTINGAEQALH